MIIFLSLTELYRHMDMAMKKKHSQWVFKGGEKSLKVHEIGQNMLKYLGNMCNMTYMSLNVILWWVFFVLL